MNNQTNSKPVNSFSNFAWGFFALICFGLLLPVTTFGSDEGHAGPKEKFNAGKVIIEHIRDQHSVHFFGHVTLPLPVILYTDKGIDVFMASEFWDEHHHPSKQYTSAKTGYTYANIEEKIVIVEPGTATEHSHEVEIIPADTLLTDSLAADSALHAAADTPPHVDIHSHAAPVVTQDHKLIDFSITKSVFGMLLILAALVFIFARVAKAYQKRKGQAPKGMQNLMETLVLFVRDDIVVPSIGKKKAPRYLPFLLTMFFFIWICNLLGLVPFLGGFNITGTLSITMVLATMVFVITTVSGNRHYWGHIVWPPGIALGVKVILVPIEIASILIKPAVLMIRLTANINAGHIVILALTSLIFIFGERSAGAGMGVGIASSLFMIFMYFIELLVSFLQAYVFTLLAALYFGDATHEPHHQEAHH